MHPRSIPGADKFARFGVEKMQCIAMPFSVCFEKALYLLEISFAFSFFRRHSRSEFYSFNHHRALIGEQLKSPQLQLRPASPSFAQLCCTGQELLLCFGYPIWSLHLGTPEDPKNLSLDDLSRSPSTQTHTFPKIGIYCFESVRVVKGDVFLCGCSDS